MGWMLLVIATVLLMAYGWAAGRQARPGRTWPQWRKVSFVLGAVLLPLGYILPVWVWGHHSLYGHMVQHLLLGMVVPLGLVFGAPLSLLLRSMPTMSARALVSFLQRPVFRFLSHPVTALNLNVGGMYLLYLSPLYGWSLANTPIHVLVHIHFVVAGCLFTWSIAGPDPGPARPTFRFRLVVLFFSIAVHGLLAKLMYAYGFPRGIGATPGEIESAAVLMYYGGDLVELVLVIALLSQWFRRRQAALTSAASGSPASPPPPSQVPPVASGRAQDIPNR